MNRKEGPEHIKLIQAWLDGAKLQWFYSEAGSSKGVWSDFETDDEINLYGDMEYRIKPKEPREWWMDPDDFEIFDQDLKPTPTAIKVREIL